MDQFISFFREKLEIIRNTDFKDSNRLFRKILYVGIIDALAKTTCHPKKNNRERLVSFLQNFSGWIYCDKVSLPHLARLLKKLRDPEFSPLRKYTFTLLDQWVDGMIITLEKDPDYQEIKDKWPKVVSKPLDGIQIDFLKHSNLFYRYRNSLVHELREPGYGMEFHRDIEPFYHFMTELETDEMEPGSGEKTWELVYPLNFYDKICETSLNRLREYYLKDRIDPYSCYTFGTYWIEELNQ